MRHAEKSVPRLGQPIVIDNKPRVGTTRGIEIVAESTPEGYAVLVGPIGVQAIVRLTFRKLGFDRSSARTTRPETQSSFGRRERSSPVIPISPRYGPGASSG